MERIATTYPTHPEEHLSLYQRMADGIHWLAPDGRQVYVNDALCQALGYTREELLTRRIPDIAPSFPQAAWLPAWDDVQQRGARTFETTHQCKDGRMLPVEVSASYRECNGQAYICSFIRDLTERKRVEQEQAALQEQIIAAQQAALRELSTPLIPITERVVAMPLIGTIDTARAQQIMATLLDGIARHQSELAILDITGVQVVDTQVANALLQAAQAVQLLGAQVVLTGIQPRIAQTLVHLGVDLRGLVTHGTLQAGIVYALNQTEQLQRQGKSYADSR